MSQLFISLIISFKSGVENTNLFQFIIFIPDICMFDEKVVSPEQFTIRERNRKSTDVCCTIIGALFALVMFIAALSMWNKGTPSFKLDKF